jgi:hypothetical protein
LGWRRVRRPRYRAAAAHGSAPVPPAEVPQPVQPVAVPQPAQPAPSSANPIGAVATLQGGASVTRSSATSALKVKDAIFKGDVLQTTVNGTLGITFDDATTFSLRPNSRIAVDEFVYQERGTNNIAAFDVVRGTIAFVASAVAKTGDMKIVTPTATIGIRGTTGVIEIPGATGAAARASSSSIPTPTAGSGGSNCSAATAGRSACSIAPSPPMPCALCRAADLPPWPCRFRLPSPTVILPSCVKPTPRNGWAGSSTCSGRICSGKTCCGKTLPRRRRLRRAGSA